MCQIKVKLDIGATMPIRAHETDAGLDLCAKEGYKIEQNNEVLISTGVHVEIPSGCFGLVALRSGFAWKNKVILLNAPGIIDQSYRGEIKLAIKSLNEEDVLIRAGDRIAQLVIIPCLFAEPMEVSKLEDTSRGEGGFGSTGA